MEGEPPDHDGEIQRTERKERRGKKEHAPDEEGYEKVLSDSLAFRLRVSAEYSLSRYVEFWKSLAKVFYLGQVMGDDIGLVRMMYGVVLVISLCRIKSFERGDLCDDGTL